jgi:hypothetical protein
MRDGDTVLILGDTEDSGAEGVLRGQAEIAIGGRVRRFRVVRFADGHEGAYEDFELRVVEKEQGNVR